ncbi:hypothetical protein CDEF62S_03481 [Castellaniella defragrans]|uniref:hypothetical protein n=1 Tax=unclassified Castellaniella TaxID=2617606 RepID=UPI003314AC2C
MKRHRYKLLLPVALGLSDGILNTLMLAANRLQGDVVPVTLSLAFRIAAASAVESAFMLFVAGYAQLRGELVHADRQLNVLVRGRMARTRQGRAALLEAAFMALVAGMCSFVGAGAPLFFAAATGVSGYPVLAVTVVSLGVLGISIARAAHGRPIVWAAAMLAGGFVVTVIGVYLHIV